MKKHKLLLFIALLSNSVLFAQKIPDMQQGSFWLSNVKIDGKLNEWPSPLKAFNKATHCWYSVANDDKNLYLAIKSNRTAKIFDGGITLRLNNSSLTYPVNKKRDRTKLTKEMWIVRLGDPRVISDFKEIGISGIEGINDTLISMYNLYGIRIAINEVFEKDEKYYEYELAIPLKKITDLDKPLNYIIRLNGIIIRDSGGVLAPIPGKKAKEMAELDERIKDGSRVSQLSGQYILAKKP